MTLPQALQRLTRDEKPKLQQAFEPSFTFIPPLPALPLQPLDLWEPRDATALFIDTIHEERSGCTFPSYVPHSQGSLEICPSPRRVP